MFETCGDPFMRREERQEYLNKRLKELVSYAYRRAPGIKARFDRAGLSPLDISDIRDLNNLPILRKDGLVELHKSNPPFGGLVTAPMSRLQRVYVSPGPIYDPHHDSRSYWSRHVQVAQALGFVKGDIAVNTWAYHLVPAGLVLDEILRRVGATVIPTGVGNTELQVQIMKHLKASAFCGTTGFFMNITDKAEEMGYEICRDFNLRLAVIGGEMGGGPIRTSVEQKYDITTRDFYGTADVGWIAYECSERNGMHIAEDIIVEITSPETAKPLSPGGVGEIVVTPIDKTYPLMRFGTGDLAGLIDEPCPCGRTSLRITRILGRVGDAVRVRGMFIHPRQLEPSLAEFSEVSRYQAVVTRPGHRDELTLRIELKKGDMIDREKLTQELIKVVSDAVRIKVDRVEFVSKGVIPEAHKLIVDERAY